MDPEARRDRVDTSEGAIPYWSPTVVTARRKAAVRSGEESSFQV